MSWLLNSIYVCLVILGSPWLAWRYFVQRKNRRGWSQKFLGLIPPRVSNEKCLWFHAVSVGEVNLLAPILDRLKDSKPDWEIAISTTTETGFDLAREKYSEHFVFFCPFDFTWAVKQVLKRLRPCGLVLAELELWPNLIRITRDAGIPVAVVNGRLSASSFRGYHRFRWLIAPALKRISSVTVQNQTYADRFIELGLDPSHLCVTGSVKFDGVETDRNNAETLALANEAGFAANDFVWVAGSTQPEEDLIAALTYQQLAATLPNLKLVLVPRHPERCGDLQRRLQQLGIPSRLRSRLGQDQGLEQNRDNPLEPVLIVDVIGELGRWWGTADVAYVGGSMGRRGGQNMIEPAAYGVPVSFGPDTENFHDIVTELLVRDAAVVVHDAASMQDFIQKTISHPEWAHPIGSRAQTFVLEHAGASQRTADSLCLLIDGASDQRRKPTAIHAA